MFWKISGNVLKNYRDKRYGMELRKWSELPDKMRTREVRKYYNILVKRSSWFRTKRLLDIIVASIMLAVLAIPMAVIAVFIKLDSPGPVFFRQERVTQYGKIFNIYKFRTMVDNASSLGTQVTVKNDSRITRVGGVLRKLRADEFPQLFNILAGDMTLVGTRPEVKKYVAEYTPEMYATLLLPAGLTSRTSIAYKDEDKLLADAKNADEVYINEVLPAKMKYNLESLKKFGLKSDMSVLWNTFVSVFKK
jgi:lipopolysaccharide/colanic/teichoic acid biosynthesis glycosyltransferase